VRFSAIELTFSVRSFQVPAAPGTFAWPPSWPSVPTSRATRVTSSRRRELVDHRVDRVLQLADLAARVDGDLLRQVALGDRGGHVCDVADLAREVRRHEVHVLGELLPGSRDAGHVGLAAELTLRADLTGHAGHLVGEGGELGDHRVDRVGERGDLALGLDRDLLGEVALGHRGGDVGDAAHLIGQVGGHDVHVLGEVLPGAGDPGHLGLAAELALRADLARHAGDLRGEGGELGDHRVDRVRQRGDLALGLDRDRLGEVALGDRGGDRARCRGPGRSGCAP
jgi:hypothetical protein